MVTVFTLALVVYAAGFIIVGMIYLALPVAAFLLGSSSNLTFAFKLARAIIIAALWPVALIGMFCGPRRKPRYRKPSQYHNPFSDFI